jgi:hypothetical protein
LNSSQQVNPSDVAVFGRYRPNIKRRSGGRGDLGGEDLGANDGDAIVGQLGDLALKGANVIVASEWHIQALR